jgi:hypothetical protein
MSLVVPTAQFRPDYRFAVPEAFSFESWLTLVAPTGTAVTLNGSPVSASSFAAVTGTPYSVARLQVVGTAFRVAATAPVGAYVYGYSPVVSVSYFMPAGMSLLPSSP